MRPLIWVTSTPSSHFNTAIAENDIDVEALDIKDGGNIWYTMGSAAGGVRQYQIEAVQFIDMDTGSPAVTAWNIHFFAQASADMGLGDPATSENIGFLTFLASGAAPGAAAAGAGGLDVLHYSDHDIKMPIFDATPQADQTVPQIFVGLQPIGAGVLARSAATIERQIRIGLRPLDGMY